MENRTISGGYAPIRSAVICNLLSARKQKKISSLSGCVFAAILEIKASQSAAHGSVVDRFWCSLERVQKLVQRKRTRKVREALQSLISTGLIVDHGQEQISINQDPLPFAEETLRLANLTNDKQQVRSSRRIVPVPRRFLRFLAASTKPGRVMGAFAYFHRGLSLERSGGVRLSGSVSHRWIATLTGLAMSTVVEVRTWLTSVGWMATTSYAKQCVTNKRGTLFTMEVPEDPKSTATQPAECPKIGYPPPNECPKIGKLIKEPESSSKEEYKNQKRAAGVCTQTKPSIRNVQLSDLQHPDRLEALFVDAVSKNVIAHTEPEKLSFFGAATRALAVQAAGKGDAIHVFMGIVRKKLWHYISNEQEEQAHALLCKLREDAEESPEEPQNEVKQPVKRRILPRFTETSTVKVDVSEPNFLSKAFEAVKMRVGREKRQEVGKTFLNEPIST